MVLSMPSPFKHKKTGVYWYRQRTPRDVLPVAKGQRCVVVVDGTKSHLKVGESLKLSLRTKNAGEAKRRAKDVQSQFDLLWERFRDAPIELSNKQIHALAGMVYHDWTRALEDNPGDASLWKHVQALNQLALEGHPYKHPLAIRPEVDSLEQRFGAFVDIVLSRENLRISQASRQKLLNAVAIAMQEAAQLLQRRARGDYREDENAKRFPSFVPPKLANKPRAEDSHLTFDEIIDAQVAYRAAGIGAKHSPLREKTVSKYRRICREFGTHRASAFADTVTADELEGWKATRLAEKGVSPRTVSDQIATVKTVIGWGVARFNKNSALRRVMDDLKGVELPGFQKKPSDITAIRPEEAITILTRARNASDERVRWLPWLCAYTGARIGELTSLERTDFIETGGYWFFKISTAGGRKVKTASSIRYVPLHPALIEEGFLDFVQQRRGRLFANGATHAVSRWFRSQDGAGITREGVSPNHGWRHLFEDLCVRDGVSDSAKTYVTGRYNPGSAGDYGKTWVMLPGLAREIEKIQPIICPRISNAL